MKYILLPSITIAALLLGGCSVDRIPGVYRMDVQQGNYLSAEQVDQLKIGMTKDQVRFVMGTPMLIDTFHTDRWDYLYRFEPGSGDMTSEHIVLHFKGDILERIDGKLKPSESGTGKTD